MKRILYSFENELIGFVVPDPQSASSTVTGAQKPLKDCFASVKEDLLEVYRGNGRYQKTLEAVNSPTQQAAKPLR